MRHYAIYNTHPNVNAIYDGVGAYDADGNTVVLDETLIAAEIARLQAEHERTEYQRQRAAEYPPITEQLDALWKGGEAAAEMLARVQAVKSKHPKPE